jgi:hypothetical protein
MVPVPEKMEPWVFFLEKNNSNLVSKIPAAVPEAGSKLNQNWNWV